MTAGRALPLIFNFTMPLLMGNLLQQTYSLVDAAIVGKFLGINALASVGASTSVVFLILGFCNGCCGGFGIPVAQKFGARDYSTMRRYISVSLQLAAVMVTLLWRGREPGENLGKATTGILQFLSLLFVPAGVGIILHLERLQREWPAILGSVLFATLISVALTGLLLRALSRNKEAGHD